MNYILPINEFISRENWININLSNIDKYSLDKLWNLYKKIYLENKMDLSASGPKEFQKKYSNILVLYINDVEPTGFISYKKTPYGNKITLLTSIKEKKSKSLLVSKMFDLLNSKSEYWYIEASNRIEEILKGSTVNVIRDEDTIRKMIKKDIIMLNDGYYNRKLSKVDKYITKRLYGNVNIPNN